MLPLLLAATLAALSPALTIDHVETVAVLRVTAQNDSLHLRASLDKEILLRLLRDEDAACSPRDLLDLCAEAYLRNNFQLRADGQAPAWQRIDRELTRQTVDFEFAVAAPTSASLEFENTYGRALGHHAQVRIHVDLPGVGRRGYTLGHERELIVVETDEHY